MTNDKVTNSRALRNCIGQFVEDANADAVAVIWSSTNRNGTTGRIATWGNQFALKSLILKEADNYQIERMNSIIAKTEKNPKKPKPNEPD